VNRLRSGGGARAADVATGFAAGRRRRFPSRRPLRTVVVLLGAAIALGGCATKRDMKLLRDDVIAMQARQDSIMLAHQLILLDSLRRQEELLLRVRGDLGQQLLQMEQQLVMIQELTGQSQRRLAELRQQMDSRSQEIAGQTAPPGGAAPPAAAAPPGTASAEQLYAIGMQQLQQSAPQTARRAFEQVVRDHSTHERAPDAQYNIGETYVLEQQYDRAIQEFDRVMQLFPNSARVPTALYRAGVIAEERGNTQAARQYYQRVVSSYPRSDERQMAEDRLRRLRRN
jgi:tol-pal system protein YbgF